MRDVPCYSKAHRSALQESLPRGYIQYTLNIFQIISILPLLGWRKEGIIYLKSRSKSFHFFRFASKRLHSTIEKNNIRAKWNNNTWIHTPKVGDNFLCDVGGGSGGIGAFRLKEHREFTYLNKERLAWGAKKHNPEYSPCAAIAIAKTGAVDNITNVCGNGE